MKNLFALLFGSPVAKARARHSTSLSVFGHMLESLQAARHATSRDVAVLDARIAKDSSDRQELLDVNAKNEVLADKLTKFLEA